MQTRTDLPLWGSRRRRSGRGGGDVAGIWVASGPAALGGSFEPRANATEGRAAVVESGGRRLLTLTGFRTDAGPDLFVYLVPGRTDGDAVAGGVRVGSLKGNIGDQQYELPAGLELGDSVTAVIWCRAFSVSFGAASLSPV